MTRLLEAASKSLDGSSAELLEPLMDKALAVLTALLEGDGLAEWDSEALDLIAAAATAATSALNDLDTPLQDALSRLTPDAALSVLEGFIGDALNELDGSNGMLARLESSASSAIQGSLDSGALLASAADTAQSALTDGITALVSGPTSGFAGVATRLARRLPRVAGGAADAAVSTLREVLTAVTEESSALEPILRTLLSDGDDILPALLGEVATLVDEAGVDLVGPKLEALVAFLRQALRLDQVRPLLDNALQSATAVQAGLPLAQFVELATASVTELVTSDVGTILQQQFTTIDVAFTSVQVCRYRTVPGCVRFDPTFLSPLTVVLLIVLSCVFTNCLVAVLACARARVCVCVDMCVVTG